MMMHDTPDLFTGARRDTLSVVTTPPDPDLAEWRARALLALALVNHRKTAAGLSAADTETVRHALLGEWDAA